MFHPMLTLLARHWYDIVALKIHAKLKLGNINLAPRGFKNSLTDNFAADPGGQGDGCVMVVVNTFSGRKTSMLSRIMLPWPIQVKLVDLL